MIDNHSSWLHSRWISQVKIKFTKHENRKFESVKHFILLVFCSVDSILLPHLDRNPKKIRNKMDQLRTVVANRSSRKNPDASVDFELIKKLWHVNNRKIKEGADEGVVNCQNLHVTGQLRRCHQHTLGDCGHGSLLRFR